jgi:hypothetical protein
MKVTTVLVAVVVIGVLGVSAQSAPAAAWIGDLSRGQNILLQRGLQLQASCASLTDDLDLANWYASNFTAVHIWRNYSSVISNYLPTSPALSWGAVAYTPVVDIDPVVARSAYGTSLVSMQMEDEQDITDPSYVAFLSSTMASFRANRPNVIAYTNQAGGQFSTAAMQNYMRQVQPDMLCMDKYSFDGTLPGGSPFGFYVYLQQYRKLGLAGNNGSGAKPIPVGIYTQTYTASNLNNHVVSESEIRLNNFSAWAFGCKFVDSFLYQTDPLSAVLFAGSGTSNPTSQFQQVAETNRQSRNLGPALVQLVTTDVRMKMGRHKTGSLINTNLLPTDVSTWDDSAGLYISSIDAFNRGTKNSGLEGDVVVGYFKPLDPSFTNAGHGDDSYFMIVNGLSDPTGSAADCRQQIHLIFNFGTSGIDSLLRLSRQTGMVEEVPLIHNSGSLYSLDLFLDGGTGDLFKFNNGGTFVGVPEPGSLAMLAAIGGGLLLCAAVRVRKRAA